MSWQDITLSILIMIRDSPGGKNVPGCYKVWLLHIGERLLINFLIVIRDNDLFVEKRDNRAKEMAHILIKRNACRMSRAISNKKVS